jgi:hypothetical protein
MLLEVLGNPFLTGYLYHLIMYGSDISPGAYGIPQCSFGSEDINRLKYAIEKAGIQEGQGQESMLSGILQDPPH